jgi:sugar transferase (PEP-CTERM/EpsH1 system associated)
MQDLLYLVHRIPYPPNKGDKIRSYHMLKFLCRRYRVHLGCFIDDANDRQHIARLEAMCASCCFIVQRPLLARLRSLGALATGRPMSLPYYRSAALQKWVDQLLASGQIKRALAFSGPMAQYLDHVLDPVPASSTLHRVIDFVDVDSEKWRQYATMKRWPLAPLYRREARHLLAYEREVTRQFDGVTFVSRAEAQLFLQRAQPEQPDRHKVTFFYNGVDVDFFAPQRAYPNPYAGAADAKVLVFTGAMDYWPNVEAVQWFAACVLPTLLVRFPTLEFHIVGARPGAKVMALAQLSAIKVSGSVPDIRPYLAHATLAVAPLRIARGIQNKVLEAMSMEKTVVATPQALEGISALPGIDIVVADDEAQFIAVLSRLLAAKADDRIGRAARQRVLQDYSWERNLMRLEHVLDSVPGAQAPLEMPLEPLEQSS